MKNLCSIWPSIFEKNDDGLLFAVSGKFYGFDETTFLYGNRGGRFHEGHFFLYEKPAEDTSQTLFACGAGFLVNRQRYLELGGFDSLYHPLYYEEIDMSYRALKRGWRVEYEPRSIAYHKVQATITQQEKRKQIGYISGRNNYLFLWKNILDRGMTAAFLVYTPLYLLRDLCRFKFRFWICFYMALKRIGPALEGRRKEREARLPVSDKEALQRINAQSPTAKTMKLAICLDAGDIRGMGHCYRQLRLARCLQSKDYSIDFLPDYAPAIELLHEAGFVSRPCEPNDILPTANTRYDAAIVDLLDTKPEYIRQLKQRARKIVVLKIWETVEITPTC